MRLRSTCLVIPGILDPDGEPADLRLQDIPEYVNYRLYGSTVLSFHFREFNERPAAQRSAI